MDQANLEAACNNMDLSTKNFITCLQQCSNLSWRETMIRKFNMISQQSWNSVRVLDDINLRERTYEAAAQKRDTQRSRLSDELLLAFQRGRICEDDIPLIQPKQTVPHDDDPKKEDRLSPRTQTNPNIPRRGDTRNESWKMTPIL